MSESLPLLSNTRVLITILLLSAVTFSTRAFPFIIFGGKRTPPRLVLYLGKYLPPALICAIIVYCFRDVSPITYPYGLPELIGAACVVGFHLWKENTMLSIFGGTAVYMVLVQMIF